MPVLKSKAPKHEQRFYTKRDIAEMIGISLASVERYAREGKLPQPVRFNGRMLRWPKEPIDAWMKNPTT